MVNINLLPTTQKIPIKILIFALVISMTFIFLHFQCHQAMLEKQVKINLLKKAIHNLDAEIANLSPKNRHFILPKHSKNFSSLTLLKKLPAIIPIGLYLTELSLEKNNYKLVGYAEKTNLISSFVTQLTHLQLQVFLQEMAMEQKPDNLPIKFFLVINPL